MIDLSLRCAIVHSVIVRHAVDVVSALGIEARRDFGDIGAEGFPQFPIENLARLD